MSARRLGGHHTVPDNPTYLDFPRSDGDQSNWPKNTERKVDHEGCVNYMRIMSNEESGTIGWRVSIGVKLAQQMGLEEGPTYVLRNFPDGYQLYDHNKGPAANPRHDPYLIGSVHVNRFRSTNEFIPHALWLMTDSTLNRANCGCKYCAKKPQRIVTDTLGLSSKQSTPQPSKQSISRHREARVRQPSKPYAAVRRAPKPSKLPAGPQQCMVPERDVDIRAAFANQRNATSRWHRKGELVWCALNPPIVGQSETIVYWPGIVEDVNVKTQATLQEPDNIAMAEASAVPGSSGQPSDQAQAPVVKQEVNLPYSVRQWNVYSVKLLAVTHIYYVSDEQVLPYLAYAPHEELLGEIHEEFMHLIQDIPPAEMEGNLKRSYTFDPCSVENVDSPEGERVRFSEAVTPFALAVQIASKLARFWEPTDEWDCKFVIPPLHPPPPSVSAPASVSANPEPALSLHALITQSMANNATRDLNARASVQSGPPPEAYGPEGVSATEFQAIKTRLLGNQASAGHTVQVVNQLRYQGLWWGAERIWTDELVRLKLARCQFAPHGTDIIYAPSGPSASTMQHAQEHAPNTDPHKLGASEKGLFLRLEGLFVVDVPKVDGQGLFRECRASGTIFELADADWDEEPEVAEASAGAAQGKGKGKERAADVGAPQSISAAPASNQAEPQDVSGTADVSGASQGLDRQSFMPGPSSLKPSLLPNPDPSVPVSQTTTNTMSQTVPTGKKSKKRTLNMQLSHPVLTTPYPLPPPPKGFKFRPILPPGHEVVLSLSLISGRYYPGLFTHPLMLPALDQALILPAEQGGLYENRHLWAMEGLLPGVHQSMDPVFWKASRHHMFKDADQEARDQLLKLWEVHQQDIQQAQFVASQASATGSQLMDVQAQNVAFQASGSEMMDVDVES